MPGTKSYLGLAGFRERRRYPRATAALNYIKVGDGNGGILMNISEEGMALTTAEGLIGEFVPLLRFRLSDDEKWIEASGRIVWLNETKKGAGIEFVEISDEDRQEIRRWVHSKISLEEPENHEPARARPKPSKEVESTLITGPSPDPRAAEAPYEIQEPSLRKMFPSENEIQPESALGIGSHEVRVENPGEHNGARPQDYFPSEAEVRRQGEETAIPASAQIESHVQSRIESSIQLKTNAANGGVKREPTKVEESIPARERPQVGINAHDKVAASAAVYEPPLAAASTQANHAEKPIVDDAPPRRLRIPTFGYDAAGEDEVEQTGSSWRNWSHPTAPSPTPDMNESSAAGLAASSPRVPSFGYEFSSDQKEEDWTKWVDPAASSGRRHLGLAVVGVLLIVVAFTIGITFGQGSLDGLIETVKEHIPDRFQQTPNTPTAGPTTPESSMATSAPAAPDVTHIARSTPSTPPYDASASTSSDAASPAGDKNIAEKNAASDAADHSTAATAAKKGTEPSTPAPDNDSRSTAGVVKNDIARNDVSRNGETRSSETRSSAARNAAKHNDIARNDVARNIARNDAATSPEETGSVLVAATGNSKMPFRLTTEEKAVSASSSVAISSQASVLVPRTADADSAPKRLKPGVLVFRVDPAYPKKVGRNEVQVVKLLATVGENGEVRNVQRLSGTPLFASAAISAVREWRYSPTLFDGRPVPTEQKITVAFRSR